MNSMTSICSPNLHPAVTSCTICSANTPAPLPPVTTPAGSSTATGPLLDYYLHACLTAGRHFAIGGSVHDRPQPGNPPVQAPGLSNLAMAGAWLEAERANLHAAVDHAASRERFGHAIAIPAAMSGFLATRGHWYEHIALHQIALTAARRAGDRSGRGRHTRPAGPGQQQTGDYAAAAASLAQAAALFHDLEDLPGEADALSYLGFLRTVTGGLPSCRRQPPAGPGASPPRQQALH